MNHRTGPWRTGAELVIVGAGGFARESAEAVAAVNAQSVADGRGPTWRLLGFLDDDPALEGRRFSGVPVLGGTDLIHTLPEVRVVVCVGNPQGYFARAHIAARLDLPDDRYATIVHPSAQVSPSSSLGAGTVILAQSVLTASATVGAHVSVMPHAVLTHDVVVADFATITSGVCLGGGTLVERGAYLGAGALLREGIRVGAWSQIGMGSVVMHDVPPAQVWVGTPARPLRGVDVPADLSDQLLIRGLR